MIFYYILGSIVALSPCFLVVIVYTMFKRPEEPQNDGLHN